MRVAVHLHQWANEHTGRAHIEREHRQAVVLGHVGVRAGKADTPIGVLAAAGPYLLSVQPPAITVAHSRGGHIGQVATRIRLAEHLAPDLGTRCHVAHPPVALRDGAVLQQHRPGHVGAHAERVQVGHHVLLRRAGDLSGLGSCCVSTAVLLRPGGQRETVLDGGGKVRAPGLNVVAAGTQRGGAFVPVPSRQEPRQTIIDERGQVGAHAGNCCPTSSSLSAHKRTAISGSVAYSAAVDTRLSSQYAPPCCSTAASVAQ
ncbi:unannotated protein [freshwater metagenome]|uniref:Unannotated protein n=1 Tax=freshwater metagenome TaxID=449393 RepID=A0A6J7KWN4_9ZZZZ